MRTRVPKVADELYARMSSALDTHTLTHMHDVRAAVAAAQKWRSISIECGRMQIWKKFHTHTHTCTCLHKRAIIGECLGSCEYSAAAMLMCECMWASSGCYSSSSSSINRHRSIGDGVYGREECARRRSDLRANGTSTDSKNISTHTHTDSHTAAHQPNSARCDAMRTDDIVAIFPSIHQQHSRHSKTHSTFAAALVS